MGPNNNIQNNTGVSEPRPVRAPGFANSKSASENAASSADGSDTMFQNKTKKSHGMLFGMILLAILAAGGIGFGVWAMMDGNSQVAKKDEQIASLRNQLAEKSEVVMEDDTTVVDDAEASDNATSESAVDTADYIYVGEWGLKIRIPEGLHKVSYEFKQHGNDQTEGTSVVIAGTVGEGLPDFANFYKNSAGLGAVSRISKDAYSGPEYDGVGAGIKVCGLDAELIFSDGVYNYCYGGPQSVFSTEKNEQDLEVESSGVIKELLQNKDNYSKI